MSDDLEYTFDMMKDDAANNVKKYGINLRRQLLASTSKEEREAWAAKGRIASNVLKGVAHNAEITTIQIEADARGLNETVEELATIQFQKSLHLLTLDNTISGLTSRALKAVDATTNEVELSTVMDQFTRIADDKKAELGL